MKKLIRNKAALFGCIMVVVLTLCAVSAGILSPHDPLKINMNYRFAEPSAMFPLGADAYGRCIFSRLLHGARYSLGLSFLVMGAIVISTVPLVMAAAWRGGLSEQIILWLCDISMALPPAVFVLAITGVMGGGAENLVFSTICSYWGWYGRMVRSYTMTELTKGYVVYARTGGTPALRILIKHIFPNIFPGLLVLYALGIGDIILMISGYSFLGIGLPARTPEWGAMLAESKSTLLQAPQYAIYPGFCVLFTVCAFNLLGEGLRSTMSPYKEKGDE